MHVAPHLAAFMANNIDLSINLNLTDEMVDIVGDGYDLAIRIAELADSSLVARKLAPVNRVLCATPRYLAEHGTPNTIDDLNHHNCITHAGAETWRLTSKEAAYALRAQGTLVTNSSEVVREAVLSGVGIAMRSTWDIGEKLASGELVRVLPEMESPQGIAIHAIYPSRQFLPVKVRLFIDFLAELYGPIPYWDKDSENADMSMRTSDSDVSNTTNGTRRRLGSRRPDGKLARPVPSKPSSR